MVSKLEYWVNRYESHGEQTVGYVGLSQKQFKEKSDSAAALLNDVLLKNKIAAKKALDFGCGTGRMTKVIVPMFPDVYGVDIVPWAIMQARKECPKGKFRIFNGREIPFEDGFFDLVLSWTVLQHVPPEELPVSSKEIDRVLAKGGRVVLYENISTWHSNKSHIWFRSVDAYKRIFKGMEVVFSEVVKRADDVDEDHAVLILKKEA